MRRTTNEELEAFSRLKAQNRDFALFMTWLKESREEVRDTNDTTEGVTLSRGQGAAITLKEILTEVDKAHEYLEQRQKEENS